jgi:molecular chaperone HscC
LTEPTAAALAYGVQAGEDEKLILVADIGGGTFDVSLLHCFEGVIEVRATAGDTWLGGEDFVTAIVNAFMNEAGAAAGLPPVSEILPIHGRLRHQAELAKRRLSEADEATMTLAHDGRDISWTIRRADFERLAEPVLARVRGPLERALRDARVDPATLSQVILAGGASRMPMFRRLVGRLFKRMPLQHINPDEVVAKGAAVRAGLLARDADLSEMVMTDVAPFTLGVDVMEEIEAGSHIDGVYMPIIERNTVIPASRSKVVVNVFDNQKSITLNVYQGEARLVKDNISLGKLIVPCPPAPAGKTRVDVRFTYDTSGLLEVDATVIATGQHQTLVIEGNPGALSKAEIATRLEQLQALKLHPRDEAENQALVARGNRMYEQHLGQVRTQIGAELLRFVAALEAQNPDRIRQSKASLQRLLDAYDDDLFL